MSDVKERPILFSGRMVQAILEGRKTVTRRVIKPQPNNPSTLWPIWSSGVPNCDPAHFCIHAATNVKGKRVDKWIPCPYGKPGDRLWVRETWCKTDDGVEYRADVKSLHEEETARVMADYGYTWKPSIHMRRNDSRILLEVVSIQADQLQEINNSQAIAEGIVYPALRADQEAPSVDYGIKAFAGLWNSINGLTYPWKDNPWVWVVEFKRIEERRDAN